MREFLKSLPCRVNRSWLELGSCGKLKGAPERPPREAAAKLRVHSLEQNNKGTLSEWDQAQPAFIAKSDALLVQRCHEAA